MSKIKCVNPSTEEVIGEINVSTIGDVENAVNDARDAFKSWKKVPVDEKINLMKKFSEALEKEKDVLIKLIMSEVGKPGIESETEILDSQATIEYYCKEIKNIKEKKIGFDSEFFPETEGYVSFEPHGVVGIIMPWNYPLISPMWFIIPVLLTGNTIVFKPSEKSLLTAKKLDEIINKIFPKGVFNVVYGDKETGKLLVKQPINKLFFTGSIRAARDIKENIDFVPLAVETGGKDSAIVCEDAEIDLAVKGVVWGAINNAGQVCTSTEKVYVHEKISKEFIEKVVKEVKKLRPEKDFGPLIDEEQLKKVEEHVKEAVSKGADILIGGKIINRKGFFFEPTVLVNVSEDMKIIKEETFGPVLPIKTVKSDEEAIELTNNSNYGLGATIWSKNIGKAKKLGEQIQVGMIWINEVNVPFSGGDY